MLMIQTLTNLIAFHYLFISSHPKNVICSVHTMSCYELNKHTRTLTTSSSNTITLSIHQHDKLTIDINTINLKTPHQFCLTSPIVLKTLTYKASSEITIPSPRYMSSVPQQTLKPRRISPTNRPTRIPPAR